MNQKLDLTLYQLETGLAELLEYRAARMADREDPPTAEELEALEGEVRRYEIATPAKVSEVAAIFRHWKQQREAVIAERQRLKAIEKNLEAMEARLKVRVAEVLELLPEPTGKIKSKVLTGADGSRLILKTNGGLLALQVDGWDAEQERWLVEETVLPAEFETAMVRMPLDIYAHLIRGILPAEFIDDVVLLSHAPDKTRIRAALAEDCDHCVEFGPSGDCPICAGEIKRIVPGARLLPRGAHVEVK